MMLMNAQHRVTMVSLDSLPRSARGTLALFPLIILTACGGSGGGSASSPPDSGSNNGANGDPYATIDLGAPSTLDGLIAQRSSNGRVRGADFRTDLGPVLVVENNTEGVFDPNWAPEVTHQADEPAWALYLLDVSGLQLPEVLNFDWQVAPEHTDMWIGLANWSTNEWHWDSVTNVNTYSLPGSEWHVRTSDSVLAVVVLLGGRDESTLREIHVPGTPAGGFVNIHAPMGVNLERHNDSARSIVFTDVFKQAREWIPQTYPYNGTWNTGTTIATDENGWVTSLQPGQAAATPLLTDQEGNYPAGDYVCLYDGTGDIDFRGDATVVFEEPGRLVVNIQPSSSLTMLSVVGTDPLDPVRNIRLIMPGFEASYQTQVFHPDFLASLAQYDVLRFTEWGHTRNSPISEWSERATPDYYTQSDLSKGMSLEYMIQLANETMCDAWISVPHLADDNYVHQLAILVRDNLNPQLRCYIEYSNEVWNAMFDQAAYAQAQGLALGLSTDPFEAQLRFYARRAKQVFTIFDDVFVGQEERVVRVLAGQSANPWTGTTIMDWEDAADAADVYAVAPYFGGHLGHPDNVSTTLAMNVSQVISECDMDSAYRQATHTSQNAANAASRGLQLVAYEGGQHLVGVFGAQDNQALTDLFIATNQDMGMRQLYLDDLRRWNANGGGLFMGFIHTYAPNKWGAWGILENQNQDPQTAPKWLGIQDYLAEIAATN